MIDNKEYMQNWRKKHPEHNKQYYEKYKIQEKERVRKWKLEHPEYMMGYCQTHKSERKEYDKNYYQKHKKRKNLAAKTWAKNHPKRRKELYKKHRCKRIRKLGFIPLNESFICSEAHHIDKLFVVYIPEELHHSIPHNVWTGRNMELINDKVFEWLIEYRDSTAKFI